MVARRRGRGVRIKKIYNNSKYLNTKNIIRFFAKTPPSIVCPHFWELVWAIGCPFNCAYCYLRGTLYGRKEPRYKPLRSVLSALDRFFREQKEPAILNSGELSDSLMNPKIMRVIVDKFEEQDKHKILLVTKATNIQFLLEKVRKQTIVSFSISTPKVWKLWEHRTSSPIDRIIAASRLAEVGYEVRIRIDPIFPIGDWKEDYSDVVYEMFSRFTPERITLGTPRGLAKTLMFTEDRSWTYMLSKKTAWGKKLSDDLRFEIYTFFIELLGNLGFPIEKIALCKEEVSMWRRIGLDPGHFPEWEKCRCNCVW